LLGLKTGERRREVISLKKIVVIGSLNQDIAVKTDHIPQIGETVLVKEANYFPGGKGANQAYAIGKLGGDVLMLGAVGDDPAGKFLLNNLQSVGVNISHVKTDKNTRTGMAWITVNKAGDNCITVIQGANQRVDIPYIQENISVIEDADIILLQLEIPLETVEYVAMVAKSLGKYVILDPAPAIPLSDDLLQKVDLIKPNETEIAILTGSDIDDDDYFRKSTLLKEKGVKNVLITLGDKGVIANLSGCEPLYFQGYKVKAVDTTAAGDSFVAMLAVSISKEIEMKEAIDAAQKVASFVVTREGAQTAIPSIEELNIM